MSLLLMAWPALNTAGKMMNPDMMATMSAEEKRILEKMLIHPERGGALRLCEELDCEQSSIYRKRDRALHKFTIALYGTAES